MLRQTSLSLQRVLRKMPRELVVGQAAGLINAEKETMDKGLQSRLSILKVDRLPLPGESQRGFFSPFKVEYQIVNVSSKIDNIGKEITWSNHERD